MSSAPAPEQSWRHRVVGAAVRVAGLALLWAALWADFSPGTLVAGALVAVAVQLLFPALAPRPPGRVNPWALGKLGIVFTWMLITANLSVLRRIVSPRLSLSPIIVDVELPPCSDAVATVVANAVTLTPGTLTLDAARTPEAVTLTVHNLDAPGPEDVRADLLTLYELAAAAFPAGVPPSASKEHPR